MQAVIAGDEGTRRGRDRERVVGRRPQLLPRPAWRTAWRRPRSSTSPCRPRTSSRPFGIAVNTFRIDVPVASEGFVFNLPDVDHSDWEPSEVAAEGIVWMLEQPPSYTGHNAGMAALRAEHGIMATRRSASARPAAGGDDRDAPAPGVAPDGSRIVATSSSTGRRRAFIARHVVVQLLDAGHTVRGTAVLHRRPRRVAIRPRTVRGRSSIAPSASPSSSPTSRRRSGGTTRPGLPVRAPRREPGPGRTTEARRRTRRSRPRRHAAELAAAARRASNVWSRRRRFRR